MKPPIYILNHNSHLDAIYIYHTKIPHFQIHENLAERVEQNPDSFVIRSDGIKLHYFFNELNVADKYRQRVNRIVRSLNTQIFIELEPPRKEIIDYQWNKRTIHLAWERVEIENLMSWFSTLGGAFSAVGDEFLYAANIAGKISKHQLRLALKLGDPITVSRCKLYHTISLIQNNQLRVARRIIEHEYQFAKSVMEFDRRLYRMCLGIWEKLRYAHQQRRLIKINKIVIV